MFTEKVVGKYFLLVSAEKFPSRGNLLKYSKKEFGQ